MKAMQSLTQRRFRGLSLWLLACIVFSVISVIAIPGLMSALAAPPSRADGMALPRLRPAEQWSLSQFSSDLEAKRITDRWGGDAIEWTTTVSPATPPDRLGEGASVTVNVTVNYKFGTATGGAADGRAKYLRISIHVLGEEKEQRWDLVPDYCNGPGGEAMPSSGTVSLQLSGRLDPADVNQTNQSIRVDVSVVEYCWYTEASGSSFYRATYTRDAGPTWTPTLTSTPTPTPTATPTITPTPTPSGPDIRLLAIEVTQGIQDLHNSVELIADKRTFVRVFVKGPEDVPGVSAVLTRQNTTGAQASETLAPISPITVRARPSRLQLHDAFLFLLPDSWIKEGTITLSATIDPDNTVGDANLANNTDSVQVTFRQTPPLKLRIFNIRYAVGNNIYIADRSHLVKLASWLRRAYPIASLRTRANELRYPRSGLPNVNTLLRRLAHTRSLLQLYRHESAGVYYYGIVDDGGGFMRGRAAGIPSRIAAGPTGNPNTRYPWDRDGSYGDWYGGHELGHTLGRYHAQFCGAGGGRAFPNPQGWISPVEGGRSAMYGFDIDTRKIYSSRWKDVMTYCSFQWISGYTYEGIRAALPGAAALSAGTMPTATADRFLLVGAQVDLESGVAELDSIILLDQAETQPLPQPGNWYILLLDETGVELASYSLRPVELTDNGEEPGRPAIISELVPWVEGTARLELRQGPSLRDAVDASANAPTVHITSPGSGQTLPAGAITFQWTASDADGDPLTYTVLLSNDGGASWETLALDLDETALVFDSSQLSGGANSLLRVIASDGLLSGEDTAGPFTLPENAPEPYIEFPPDDDLVVAFGEWVSLLGGAFDREEGEIRAEGLRWLSSIDGELGMGFRLDISTLSPGVHVITLQASDNSGRSTQAQRMLEVLTPAQGAPLYLDVAPEVMVLDSARNGGVISETLSLRGRADHALAWSAGSNQPWLGLSASQGNTPANLVLSVDPAGLDVGVYEGEILIQADEAVNTSISVPVYLQIVPPLPVSAYLPMILQVGPQPIPPSATPTPQLTPTPTRTPTRTPSPTPTITPTPTPAWQIIFEDGFEGTFPGQWELYGNPSWGRSDCVSFSGTSSIWPAMVGQGAVRPCVEPYPDGLNAWIIFGPFDLSDASDAEVVFQRRQQTQKDLDWFYWMASLDGLNFYGWQSSGTTSGWDAVTFDLTDVAPLGDLRGQAQVWFAFLMVSDGAVGDVGVFVDDLQIRKRTGGIAAQSQLKPPAPADARPAFRRLSPRR